MSTPPTTARGKFQGKLAVVTGASSGLGAEFATQLAAQGAHLILVARRTDRLEKLREGLLAQAGSVENHVADLSTEAGVSGLIEFMESRNMPVDILINNAGFGMSEPFAKTEWNRVNELCQLNMVSLTRLSHWAARAFSKRGSGYLMNLASMTAFQPLPFFAVYSATKAYVSSLTMALHEELRESGVHVTCLHPGKTDTEFFDVGSGFPPDKPFMRVPGMRASEVVRVGLRGLASNRLSVMPGIVNFFHYVLAKVCSLRFKLRASSALFKST